MIKLWILFGHSRFVSVCLRPALTCEGLQDPKAVRCALAISMSQKQISLFHPERFRLFAANLMDASLRR
jgi:hypothetical protein